VVSIKPTIERRCGLKMWLMKWCRDDLVDNFSTHKEEVDKILAGVKKLGVNGH